MKNSTNDLWDSVIWLLKECKVKSRLKLKEESEWTGWSEWLTSPVPSCVENQSYGPVEKKRVDMIEISVHRTTRSGRLLPEKKVDLSDELIEKLKLKGVLFSMSEHSLLIKL